MFFEGIDVSEYFADAGQTSVVASTSCFCVCMICAIWKAVADNYALKGKHRRAVVNTTICLMVIGFLLLVASGAAFYFKEPFRIWFPPSLSAIAMLAITPVTYSSINRLYKDLELEQGKAS